MTMLRVRPVVANLAVAALAVGIAVAAPRLDAVSDPDRPALRQVAAHSSGPRQASPVFVYERGRYTAFDVPFGEAGGDGVAVNNRGQIAGGYIDAHTGCLRGFLRERHGRFTRLDVPAATGGTTQPLRIDDRGRIVGNYRSDGPTCQGAAQLRGFLRDEHGRYTTIHVPGAVYTQATGINNRGEVVGDFLGADGVVRGYRWERGRVTTIDPPAGAAAVTVLDNNDSGQTVGAYLDAAGAEHGFVRSRGVYTTIDTPGVPFTLPFGINNRGQITGFSADALPIPTATDVNGFLLRRGAGGPVTRIEFPGAVIGTVALDVNDLGTVVGMYGNPNAAAPGTDPPMNPMPRLLRLG
jgi:hypothetical protein